MHRGLSNMYLYMHSAGKPAQGLDQHFCLLTGCGSPKIVH